MAWSLTSLPASPNLFNYQALVATDGVGTTHTISNVAFLALLHAQSPLREILTATYATVADAAEAFMQVARIRIASAASGSGLGFGWNFALSSNLITLVIGQSGAAAETDALLEINYLHSIVR